MSRSTIAFGASLLLLLGPVFAACSSKDDDGAPAKGGAGGKDASVGSPNESRVDGGTLPDGGRDTPQPDPGGEGEPGLQLLGRFDLSTPTAPKAAWPGSRVVARFEGPAASARLTQLDGSAGGTSWINVIVDGVVTKKVALSAGSQDVELATGLAAGVHVVEIEKRTEANVGTIVLEAVTFPNGGQLLAPPPRKKRRIEVLSDSTIDGFGIDGDAATTCGTESPAAFDDVHKSTALVLAAKVEAEAHVIAYSGKGLVENEPGDDGERFPALYTRTLPEDPGSAWDFASWSPDVVVIALGGTDMTSETPASGFSAAYDALVSSIRARHPAAHVYMTVWSQIKDLGPGQDLRTGLRTALDGIKAAHATDSRLHVFSWAEADYPGDETGCAEHANPAHALETATEIAAAIKADLGW